MPYEQADTKGYEIMSCAHFELHPMPLVGDEVFSIVIPTWNNLAFVKLCVQSIRKNSVFHHQIILHIVFITDGTVEWAKSVGLDYTRTEENVGVCVAVNAARALVATDYVLYMNDDMYVCPGWDAALKEEIEAICTKYFYISAQMIEPYPTGSKPVIGGKNFGTTIETFEEERLLREFAGFSKEDWCGATRPPNIVHRDIFDLVGGYSIEFSPGMYSDPDFSMKLWKAGVRYFKGVSRARVYHFVSKSVGRIVKNDGRRQFLKKWGMTPSTFYRFYLRKGEQFTGPLEDPAMTPSLRWRLFRDRISSVF